MAEVTRDWAHLFPRLPHQSEANRRIRWLWGAFEQVRAMLAARLPEDDCQQAGTSALPVKHTSRVRGADGWTGPGNDLAARFGRDAAHAEWFYGFRLAIKADLGSRVVRAWSIVPAAVNEREVAEEPHRDHIQRDHRPDGAGPARRPYLLGPADPHRSHHRSPCAAPHLPQA